MKVNLALKPERARELLSYNKDTGIFTWRLGRPKCTVGSVAGHSTNHGYIRIMVEGECYQAHRIAWLYVYGHWPTINIDHINGDKADNRLVNLREANTTTNQENRRGAQSNNRTRVLGVSWHKIAKKFSAKIQVSGKSHHLGLFNTAEDAHAAYLSAKRKLHAGCTL